VVKEFRRKDASQGTCHTAIFHADQLSSCGDMTTFPFLSTAVDVRHFGQIFHGKKLMWHRKSGSNAGGCSSRANAVINVCCVHRSSDSQCFSIGRTTPKLPLLVEGSGSPSNTWFLGPIRVYLQSASIDSAVLAQLTIHEQTETQTTQLHL